MLSKKRVTSSLEGFKPFPFTIKKDRKEGFIVTSQPIDWENLDPEEMRIQWSKCLQEFWFHENEGDIKREHLKPFFDHYLVTKGYSDNDISTIRSLPDWKVPFSLMASSFLLVCGANNPSSDEYILNTLKEAIENYKPAEKKNEIKREGDWVRVDDTRTNLMSDLEYMEDQIPQIPNFKEFFLQRKVSKANIDHIEEFYVRRLNELIELLEGDITDLEEAYRNYSVEEINQMIRWYGALLEATEEYRGIKPTVQVRKERKKKVQPPSKIVSKMKYLRLTEDSKLKSISPEKILGAQLLIAYNVMRRKIAFYYAKDSNKGLGVHGSYITEFDEEKSGMKVLRKPELQLPKFIGATKAAAIKAFNEVKSTMYEAPKINFETVLLKVY